MTDMTGEVTVEGSGATITFERTIDAPQERVWRLLTDPDSLSSWLAPTRLDLRPGGEIEIDFGEEGGPVVGHITELDAPRRLAYTWRSVGERESVVEWELHPYGEQTRLTLVHRGLPEAMSRGYGAGWHAHLDRLAAVVAGDPAPAWEPLFEAALPHYPVAGESGTRPRA